MNELHKVAAGISVEEALKKALELLDESNTALMACGERRYAFMRADGTHTRPTTTRHLSYRIESFTDIARTFILKEKTHEAEQKAVA